MEAAPLKPAKVERKIALEAIAFAVDHLVLKPP